MFKLNKLRISFLFFNWNVLFRLLAQTTLRNILGTKNLHEILSDRESIAGSMQVKSIFVFYFFNSQLYIKLVKLVIKFLFPRLYITENTLDAMQRLFCWDQKTRSLHYLNNSSLILRLFWMKQLTTGASKWKEWRCKIYVLSLLIENVSAVQYM